MLGRSDPLATRLDDLATGAPDLPVDGAAARAVAGFEHDDVESGGPQPRGGHQTGDAGTDHEPQPSDSPVTAQWYRTAAVGVKIP